MDGSRRRGWSEMGYLETRFFHLITWAETKGPHGMVAAQLLQSLWQDIQGSLDKEILEAEVNIQEGAEPCTV